MDTHTLSLLLRVMDLGSFAAAARALERDPSIVSRSIAGLEAELGVSLFTRSTRRLVPTEAGARFVARVRPLLNDLEDACDELREQNAAPSGLVRITASMAFGQSVLLPLLPRVQERHPDLEIDLALSDQALDLLNDRIDVAIRLGPPPDTALRGRRLMDVRHRVCASPAYCRAMGQPETISELEERDCVLFALPGYRPIWRFRDHDTQSGREDVIAVRGRFTIASALGVRQAARDGLGPALLADWMIHDDLATGRLVDLLPDHDVTATTFDEAAWLLLPGRGYVPRRVRAVIDLLQGHLSAEKSQRR